MAIFVNKDSLSEKDIEKFLLVCLFGSRYNTIKTDREKIALAIRRAYRDFCRTIRKRKGDINDGIYIDNSQEEEKKDYDDRIDSKGKAARKIVCAIDNSLISVYNDKHEDFSGIKKHSLTNFDEWHKDLCNEIVKEKYTYGQAQKWVNMTLKYLLVLKYEPIVAVLNNLHIPLDSIILEIATNKENNLITKKQLKEIFNKETELENKDGQPAEFSWSRINSYPKYLEIQTILRKNLKDKKGVSIPILWEFDTWNESTEKK